MQVRRVIAAAGAACALIAAGGCGVVGTGVEVAEDGADTATSPEPDSQDGAAEGEAFSIDPVEVLREDEEVRQDIKDLVARPCVYDGVESGWFPVETTYATVAAADMQIAIVEVLGCADPSNCTSIYASYVYWLQGDDAEQVYSTEETSATVSATGGELFADWPVWEPGDDDFECPTGLESVPLTWDGDEFVPEGG